VCGHDVADDPIGVRRSIGVTFQQSVLDQDFSGFENLRLHARLWRMAPPEASARIAYLLDRMGLAARANDGVRTYSGGMRRRLEIARALLAAPQVLFLDEPTLGLDPQSRNQLWTHVKHLNETERVTVFLTTHYMDEADRVAHRIAIIDRGRIVAQGSSQELRAQTKTDSLEQAFLALTGSTIRDERADAADQMRQVAKMWRR
jgi:ABC-2 type transport system ATP-binding protein